MNCCHAACAECQSVYECIILYDMLKMLLAMILVAQTHVVNDVSDIAKEPTYVVIIK